MLKKRSSWFKTLIVILVITCFLLLAKIGDGQIKNTFYFISSPFSKALWKGGDWVSDFFGGLFRIGAIRKENQELLRQNLTLFKEVADLKSKEEENKFLRSALDLGLEKKFKLALGELVFEDVEHDLVVISAGRKDGIVEGMAVITKEEILVGKVKKSFSDFSEVELISSPGIVFDVEIQGEKSSLGVARGKGRGEVQFDLVPKEEKIEKGAVALTTALGGAFPKGLLVGVLREVIKTDVEPFQRGTIEPYFQRVAFSRLFVITEK